jgi:ABC-type sugar transport system substrate-binding protein
MSSPIKLVASAVLAALVLSACGTSAKPVAGTAGILHSPGNHAKVDDPRIAQDNHLACLQADHLPITEVGQTDLRIGTAPGDPTVHFTPTPGDAQGLQIDGKAQSAEVIGSALLYPHQASDSELKQIEDCLAQGVKG